MQAHCFDEYMRCIRENTSGTLASDLVCTSDLTSCVNAHLYGSLGEHLVDRPGDAVIVNQTLPEVGLVVVERLTTSGQRDGCQYELSDSKLASKAEVP